MKKIRIQLTYLKCDSIEKPGNYFMNCLELLLTYEFASDRWAEVFCQNGQPVRADLEGSSVRQLIFPAA